MECISKFDILKLKVYFNFHIFVMAPERDKGITASLIEFVLKPIEGLIGIISAIFSFGKEARDRLTSK